MTGLSESGVLIMLRNTTDVTFTGFLTFGVCPERDSDKAEGEGTENKRES